MPSLPTRTLRVFGVLAAVCLAAIAVDQLLVPALLGAIEPLRDLTPRVVVRVHVFFVLSFLLVAALLLWNTTADRDLRRKVLLLDLIGTFAIALVLIALSKEDLLEESSPITLLTTLTLFLASIAAFAIFFRIAYAPEKSPLPLRILWLLVGTAFFVASIDETLRIHERIGEFLSGALPFDHLGAFQVDDFTTLAYAFGGLLFVALFIAICFREYVRKDRCFYKIFIAAILVYVVSVLLDTLEPAAVPAGAAIDYLRLANTVEEFLEFFAANLFLVAFLVEILEARDRFCLSRLDGLFNLKWTRGRAARRFVLGGAAVYLLGLASVAVLLPPGEDRYVRENGGYEIELFADHRHHLEGIDGIFFHDGSLYAANEAGSRVVRIDSSGRAEILADASDGLVSPESIAAHEGRVYFSDDHLGAVFSWSEGTLTKILGRENGLRSPEGLAIDSRGILHIADEATSCIYRYENGALSIVASALQGLEAPEEIRFDRFDNLYVTDDVQGVIFKIDPSGYTIPFASTCRELVAPEAIHISGDTVYVTDIESGTVFRFDLGGNGGPLLTFTSRHKEIQGIATDDTGRLYLALSKLPPLPSKILRLTPPPASAAAPAFAHGPAPR